ncbi:hypothetical protein BDI01nite_20780 [Brevundimonas diminuta]|nr:hypothetical protein [Brevundimonas diminuta]EGF94728.1 hypothetical protein BDIM_15560 [Brevundimonas diminuta ATCC 11568]GEC01014.1 hypothetical protein BDI01nite_20780 [Brevundimonas diminuta]
MLMSDCKRAGAYLALARDYAEAAGVVLGKRADLRSYWHLIAHALELALKAQILRVDGEEAWLMSSVGHSLERAMTTVVRNGASAPIPRDIAHLIEVLDAPHSRQELRYPSLLGSPVCFAPAAAHAALAGLLEIVDGDLAIARRGS